MQAPTGRRFFRSRKGQPRQPSLHFSLTGYVYCSMMMFMGLAAMNTQANLLFGVFGLMIGTLTISGVISKIILRKLSVHRTMPEHGVVGEPLTVFYEIANGKKRWPSLSVCLSELDSVSAFDRAPQCYMMHAAPSMTASIPVELIPARRGLWHLDQYQLSTSFPFGFVKRAVIGRKKNHLCIYPALADVDARALEMCRAGENMGESLRPRAGGTDEFFGLREYRPGDNPRHIYWRRSARTGTLVAREMMRDAPPRLLIIVDTFRADANAVSDASIEHAIAIAASLAAAAMDRELAVGLCAADGQPFTITPARGKQHRDELLTILARLKDNRTVGVMDLLRGTEAMMRSGVSVVLVTPRVEIADLPPHIRGGILILSAGSEQSRSCFRFRPGMAWERTGKLGVESAV